MKLEEIKLAVAAGKTVHWATEAYRVIDGGEAGLLIRCDSNNHCMGLTHLDGVTLNGEENEFFVAGGKRHCWSDSVDIVTDGGNKRAGEVAEQVARVESIDLGRYEGSVDIRDVGSNDAWIDLGEAAVNGERTILLK